MKPDPVDSKTAEIVAGVIKHRRSTRHFADKLIPKSILLQLVEAGISAPSGSNWQNQRFLIIDDKWEIDRIGKIRFVWPYRNASQEKIRELHPAGIIGNAQALIVVFSDAFENDRRGMGEYYIWQLLEIQNCSAAIENILILSTGMGIASCWVSASDNMNYTRLLSAKTWHELFPGYDIPVHFKIQGIILLGYPTRTDPEGFPTGEQMHGATLWQSTDRKPLDHYLINARTPGQADKTPVPTAWQRFRLRVASALIRILLKCVGFLDRSIHRIEVDDILNRSR